MQEAVPKEHWGQLGMQYGLTASCVWVACMAGAQLGQLQWSIQLHILS